MACPGAALPCLAVLIPVAPHGTHVSIVGTGSTHVKYVHGLSYLSRPVYGLPVLYANTCARDLRCAMLLRLENMSDSSRVDETEADSLIFSIVESRRGICISHRIVACFII